MAEQKLKGREELVNYIKKRLRKYKHKKEGGVTEYNDVPGKELLNVPLSIEILKLRQNKSPIVKDFLGVAKEYLNEEDFDRFPIRFDLYVVDKKSRKDYGDIVITAIAIPSIDEELVKEVKRKILSKVKARPNDEIYIASIEGPYVKMWWD